MKTLYIAWQDPKSRVWMPVGELTRSEGMFCFRYTLGAQDAMGTGRFLPFGRMTELDSVYESDELFPLFNNRVLTSSRPEFGQFLQWLDIEEPDPFVMLGRTGGERATDSLLVFPKPEMSEQGRYTVHFFSHGIGHLRQEERRRIADLHPGERLLPLLDVQNDKDAGAIALRTDDPPVIAGYVPRFLAHDLRELMSGCALDVSLRVHQVNTSAPSQLRLLCVADAPWPVGFAPCSDSQFRPFSREAVLEVA